MLLSSASSAGSASHRLTPFSAQCNKEIGGSHTVECAHTLSTSEAAEACAPCVALRPGGFARLFQLQLISLLSPSVMSFSCHVER